MVRGRIALLLHSLGSGIERVCGRCGQRMKDRAARLLQSSLRFGR